MAAPAPGLKVAVGHDVYDSGDAAKLTAAVAAQNARQRIEGLPDELNPSLIDPAKLQALLQALSPETRQALGGRVLFLDGIGLRIATSSPSSTASFAGPVSLKLGRDEGGTVAGSAAIPADCAVARSRAAAARAQAQAADQAVTALEAKHGNATPARVRRYAAARAWEDNSAAAASCAPDDPAAAADHAAAAKAAEAAIMLGGSMG